VETTPKNTHVQIHHKPIILPSESLNVLKDIAKTKKGDIIFANSIAQYKRLLFTYWAHRTRLGYQNLIPKPRIIIGRSFITATGKRRRNEWIDFIENETEIDREKRILSQLSPYVRHINTSRFYEDLATFRDKIDENPFEDIFAAIQTGSHIKLHEILTFTPELTLIAINRIDDFNLLGNVSRFFEFALE
jgi:hypothetical protein